MKYTIIVLVVAFLGIATLLSIMYQKGKKTAKKSPVKKEDPKPEAKPATDAKAEEKKDDIPEILKEVTRGNYMFDNAQLSEEEALTEAMVENSEIKKEEEPPFRVTIDDILEDDLTAITTQDILDEMDRELDDKEDENEGDEPSVGKQIKKMSPKMKAILIADILNKKD